MIFFNPDSEMVDWLIKLANDKLIINFGAGDFTLESKLLDRGYQKCIGVEPYQDTMQIISNDNRLTSKVINSAVEEPLCQRLVTQLGHNSIGLICRPCHDEFIIAAQKLAQASNMPLYYIGLERNIDVDLDEFGISYERVSHAGSSKDGEIVLKIA